MVTATATKTDLFSTPFEIPSVDEVSKQIRGLGEKLVESSKSAGLVTLDAYEKALKNAADLEAKAASATKLEWVSALASTHAKFVADVTSTYTDAARDLLK